MTNIVESPEKTMPDPPRPRGYTSEKHTIQCTGHVRTGARCKRRTTKTDKCYQHLEMEDHLKVKQSDRPGTGMGLFTTVPRREGRKITDYDTKTYTADHRNPARGEVLAGHYVVQLPGERFANPYKTTDGAARYANSHRYAGGNNAGLGYSAMYQRPILKAMKNIPNATKARPREVYATYGADAERDYFRAHGIQRR